MNPNDLVEGKLQDGAVMYEIKYVRMPKEVKVKMLFLALTGKKQTALMSDVVDSSVFRAAHLLEASRLFFHYLTPEKQIALMSKMLDVDDFRTSPLRHMCKRLGLPSIGSKETLVSHVRLHFGLTPDSPRNRSRTPSPRRSPSSNTRHRSRSRRTRTLDYPSARDLPQSRGRPSARDLPQSWGRVSFGKRKGGK